MFNTFPTDSDGVNHTTRAAIHAHTLATFPSAGPGHYEMTVLTTFRWNGPMGRKHSVKLDCVTKHMRRERTRQARIPTYTPKNTTTLLTQFPTLPFNKHGKRKQQNRPRTHRKSKEHSIHK